VGTAAFILEDYIADSSVTFGSNPNYWGYDERHPENQLPYVDTLRVSIIPDEATALSALRTGKIDIMADISWFQAENMAATNPELLQATRLGPGHCAQMRVDIEPFSNINCRKALNMSINRADIAEGYFGGTVAGTPCGKFSPLFTGAHYAYEDWTDELKAEYAYDPEGAMALLDAAGYTPDPVTGMRIETHIYTMSVADNDLLQIVKDYLLDIGIDMEIRVLEPAQFMGFIRSGQATAMSWNGVRCGGNFAPQMIINQDAKTSSSNFGKIDDEGIEALIDAFNSSVDIEVSKQLLIDADKYVLEKHWNFMTFPVNSYTIYQPYLKGYTAEGLTVPGQSPTGYFARWWIDSEMKASMGR
jgi:peptide/nickel transport system substrate-binding protein